MKPGNIIAYMGKGGKIKQAVVAKYYLEETPNNIRIFDYPFNENSKSCVLGLGKRRLLGNFLENLGDYCVTRRILGEKEESLLENLIENMGPISDIR